MTPNERAGEYAALFTKVGDRWRSVVPVQGRAHKTRDEMTLDGVLIAKSRGASSWSVVAAGVPE